MKKVIINNGNDALFPKTDASLVEHQGMTLAERLNDDGVVLKDKITGVYKRLTLQNGSIVFEDFESSEKSFNILCLGNSITYHNLADYWWGRWGMAASRREKDWVHRLEAKCKTLNPNCTVYAANISSFEQNGVTDIDTLINYDISDDANKWKSFDSIDVSICDLIVIRLGENGVPSKEKVVELINNLKALAPSATYVVTGLFWSNATKEGYLREGAEATGCSFVKIDQYNTAAYKEKTGNQVYGDDGQLHTITNTGVANHPNDAGMEAIAEEIFKVIS